MGINPLKARYLDGLICRLGLAGALLLGVSAAATAMNEAGSALARGDFPAAYRLFSKGAQAGDPIAQNNLGVLYLKGKGTRRDFGSARVWFERAASRGLPGAKHNLGIMYLRGYGMSKDLVEAARWLGEAATDGDREAQFFTGLLYYRGHGVTRDLATARHWFTRAADQGLAAAVYNLAVMQLQGEGGARDEPQALAYLEHVQHESDYAALLLGQVHLQHADEAGRGARALAIFKLLAEAGNSAAQFQLGMMYISGRGTVQDIEEGRFWLLQASRLGSAAAQLNLGSLYARGFGVTRDPVEAAAWYTLAAANGEPLADQNLRKLRRELTAAETAQAENLVAALREKHATAVQPVDPAP